MKCRIGNRENHLAEMRGMIVIMGLQGKWISLNSDNRAVRKRARSIYDCALKAEEILRSKEAR